MSGRDKRAPASPEEEREQLRALTRELHEAVQDARAAARELRGARQETEAACSAMVETALERLDKRAGERLAETITALSGHTREEFPSWLVSRVTKELYELATTDPAPDVPANRPQVYVATPASLAAFRAAGGNPGIVIDARGG